MPGMSQWTLRNLCIEGISSVRSIYMYWYQHMKSKRLIFKCGVLIGEIGTAEE